MEAVKLEVSELEALELNAGGDYQSSELAEQGNPVGSQASAGTLDFSSDYSVELQCFEGPLDLLLHLVRCRDLSVKDVDMSEVCDQYLRIVESLQVSQKEVDIDRLGEYLVIASTLLALKSQRLLPPAPSDLDLLASAPEGTDPDFLEQLRERLRQYELTKKRAKVLRAQPQLGLDTFSRKYKHEQVEQGFDFNSLGESQTLGKLFVGLLHRIGETVKSYRVQLEPVGVVEMMMSAIDSLSSKGQQTFYQLVSELKIKRFSKRRVSSEGLTKEEVEVQDSALQRSVVIGSFIAVLELVKRGAVEVAQQAGQDRRSFRVLPKLSTVFGSKSKDQAPLSQEQFSELLAGVGLEEGYGDTESRDEEYSGGETSLSQAEPMSREKSALQENIEVEFSKKSDKTEDRGLVDEKLPEALGSTQVKASKSS